MFDQSHLGDRPLLLWSMAFGMMGVAFIVSFAGLDTDEDFVTAFFRVPFIIGMLIASFVMGLVRPELRRSWTIGMGGIPAFVVLFVAQFEILLTPAHYAGENWPIAVVLTLVLGISSAYIGSSFGARAALRLSPN